MGWIHERHMRHGGSLNARPEKQRRGPLRRIVAVLVHGDMFAGDWVQLECGHRVRAWGQRRSRCPQCAAKTP